jgi:hypothetical protein
MRDRGGVHQSNAAKAALFLRGCRCKALVCSTKSLCTYCMQHQVTWAYYKHAYLG